jgi:hypothetical protein
LALALRLYESFSNKQYVKTPGEKDAIFDLMKQGPMFSCAGILTRYVLGAGPKMPMRAVESGLREKVSR